MSDARQAFKRTRNKQKQRKNIPYKNSLARTRVLVAAPRTDDKRTERSLRLVQQMAVASRRTFPSTSSAPPSAVLRPYATAIFSAAQSLARAFPVACQSGTASNRVRRHARVVRTPFPVRMVRGKCSFSRVFVENMSIAALKRSGRSRKRCRVPGDVEPLTVQYRLEDGV